jgi:hypothetical protein
MKISLGPPRQKFEQQGVQTKFFALSVIKLFPDILQLEKFVLNLDRKIFFKFAVKKSLKISIRQNT